MKAQSAKWVAVVLGLAAVWMPGVALAQATHGGHSEGVSITRYELLLGIAHGNTLMSTVLLVGLPMFAALIWLPTSRAFGVGRDATALFSRCTWALFGVLLLAGLAEVALYAVRYFDEPFGMGIIVQALFGTRVGNIWLMRWGFALVTALMVFWAARKYEISYWWAAAGLGSITLLTLTQLSHAAARAAAEGRFLPFFVDWLHVIAVSVWMGGVFGFPLLLLGPLRAVPAETREKALVRAVRRFSKVATIVVTIIVVTGVYSVLLHVPSLSGLIGTAYGRALTMKLGLAVFVLAVGAVNLIDRGQGPFGRMVGAELFLALGVFVATGFLTSLPPP
jgi:copper transport protein